MPAHLAPTQCRVRHGRITEKPSGSDYVDGREDRLGEQEVVVVHDSRESSIYMVSTIRRVYKKAREGPYGAGH